MSRSELSGISFNFIYFSHFSRSWNLAIVSSRLYRVSYRFAQVFHLLITTSRSSIKVPWTEPLPLNNERKYPLSHHWGRKVFAHTKRKEIRGFFSCACKFPITPIIRPRNISFSWCLAARVGFFFFPLDGILIYVFAFSFPHLVFICFRFRSKGALGKCEVVFPFTCSTFFFSALLDSFGPGNEKISKRKMVDIHMKLFASLYDYTDVLSLVQRRRNDSTWLKEIGNVRGWESRLLVKLTWS